MFCNNNYKNDKNNNYKREKKTVTTNNKNNNNNNYNNKVLINWDGFALNGVRLSGLFAMHPAPIQVSHMVQQQ